MWQTTRVLWCNSDAEKDLASGQVFQKFILEINTQNKDEYSNTDDMCSVMWTLGQGDIDPTSGQAFQKFSTD